LFSLTRTLPSALWRDELNASFFQQLILQFRAVPGFVADEFVGKLIDERGVERSVGENNIVSGTFSNNDREWKTITVCNGDDLCCVPSATFSDARAPFFAGT